MKSGLVPPGKGSKVPQTISVPCDNRWFQLNLAMPRLYLALALSVYPLPSTPQTIPAYSQHIPKLAAAFTPSHPPHLFPLPGSNTSLCNLAPTSCPLQRPPLPPGAQAPDSLPSLTQAPGFCRMSRPPAFPSPGPSSSSSLPAFPQALFPNPPVVKPSASSWVWWHSLLQFQRPPARPGHWAGGPYAFESL